MTPRPPAEPHKSLIAPQLAPREVKPERPKLIWP
jgi:hypothetical protein